MNIRYLDHDPSVSARWLPDLWLTPALRNDIVMLSCAWHLLDNEFTQPMDAERRTPWLALYSHPAQNAETLRGRPYVRRTSPFPGESGDSEWRLFGQHIAGPTYVRQDDDTLAWICSATGNYTWVWRHAMALLDELQSFRAKPGRHPWAPYVWALETPPFQLPEGDLSEPPVNHICLQALVIDAQDDTVDGVASNRAQLCREHTSDAWRPHHVPVWFESVEVNAHE